MPDTDPLDQADRDRIATELDSTLFVEAGAGSGKTSALVARVHALVVSGVPIEKIAAITFTEKAAAELRDRIREQLSEPDDAAAADPVVRHRREAALDALDRAAIGTLHSFARRVLADFALEAGVPPGFEVLDDISSRIAFDERWRVWRTNLLAEGSTPDTQHVLLMAKSLKIGLEQLRQVALAFGANHDLLVDAPPLPAGPPSFAVDDLIDAVLVVCHERHRAVAADPLAVKLAELERWALQVRHATDVVEALELCARNPKITTNVGQQRTWDPLLRGGPLVDLRTLKGRLRDLAAELAGRVDDVRERCLATLALELCELTLAAAADRRATGRLEFHDLLVLSRGLVRDARQGRFVRSVLHDRYERLLIDEFQDTDPIQVELVVRIAGGAHADAAEWQQIAVPPGRLFFVGDPKQSIYRFRRADIGLYLEARARLGSHRAALTTNFRSTRPIIEWINQVFGTLIVATEGSQPDYEALHARHDGVGGPPVVALGTEPLGATTAEDRRYREAVDVAACISRILSEGWEVRERDETLRPARPGDITILLPTRTSLAALQRALDDAGIIHRAEASSLVYGTDEVRELLGALRAVDDPTDELSVVAALRSPVFGCSDVDLAHWRLTRRRSWDHQRLQRAVTHTSSDGEAEPMDELSDRVGEAMDVLAELHAQRVWRAPSELLGELVRRRELFELAYLDRSPADVWRRLRFVIDQARAWSDAGGSGLRSYLEWARRQSAEGARVTEVVLPESDVEAVRIMTIHAAKGLEFPVAIVAGMTTQPSPPKGVQVAFPPGRPPVMKLSKDNTTEAFEQFVPIDEQMGLHERMRLLYVACTRARDHLVVCLHRPEDVADPAPSTTGAQLLALAGAVQATGEQWPALGAPVALAPRASPAPWEWADEGDWAVARAGALAAAERPRTVAATTLARDAFPPASIDADPGIDKDAPDLELPPWNKGRYGTAVGRAVHAVLQTVDLATGEGLGPAAVAQAAAEGLPDRVAVIEALARSALEAPAVREAADAEHWREVYVAAPLGDTLLEGYIDLLYRGPDGLVVVDYKTDHVPDDDALDAKLARYRLQGAAYALAVEAVTGERVTACVFIFCSPSGPRQRELGDLRLAMTDVRARLVPDPAA